MWWHNCAAFVGAPLESSRSVLRGRNGTTRVSRFSSISIHSVRSNQSRLNSNTIRAVSAAPNPASVNDPSLELTPEQIKSRLAVEQYVKAQGGRRTLQKILIANNGMAATKAILSMRKWAYYEFGSEKTIEFVVMATPEDLNANAEFVRLADSFVEVPGGSNKNNYANVDLIVETAIRKGVDGVWPGWGHASENPKLPNALAKNGIQFIGPTGPVMAVLGDKIGANILAQTAQVPSIPWSGDGLVAQLTDEGTIPDEIFKKATVNSIEEAVRVAARIGYPIMTKASEGGGGKGIRMSANEDELRTNYDQVVNEVPGSPVFMMQLCKNARHLEIQIVGDEHGNAVALNGRDCSTQRRFQKIFEEGPPTVADPVVFREMERAAQRLTHSIGYRGAGTVEYLYNADTKSFYFLELNPRLQVEHPVTEGLTGVNMPATQLQVAMGIPLNRIPDMRRFYGKEDLYGDSPIDFFNDEYIPITNHVIAARITAENPDEGFKPTSGRIERVRFQSSPNVWGYFSVGAAGGIHEFADSQFGHVFATGRNREEARKALVLALKELEARGEIRNPVEYLTQLLETPEFKENTIDTSWLDTLIREKLVKVKLESDNVVMAAAVYRAYRHIEAGLTQCVELLQRGQATFLSELSSLNRFPVEITYDGFKFDFDVSRLSKDRMKLTLNGKAYEVKVREQPDRSLLATIGPNVYTIAGFEEPLGLRMIIDGSTVMLPTIFDPSELRSDVTGKVVRFLQEDGAEVQKGQPYVELEAMKMIMQLSASESGKVSHELAAGSIIKTGDLLARLELKDASKTTQLKKYEKDLKMAAPPVAIRNAGSARNELSLVLQGYEHSVGPLVQTVVESSNSDADPIRIEENIAALLDEFIAVEKEFDSKALNSAIFDVRKTQDNDRNAIQMIAAHLNLARRLDLVLSLLRQLGQFPDRFPNKNTMSPILQASLEKLSELKDKNYGEVRLSADDLLTRFRTPDFESRLSELKEFIMNGKDVSEIAKSRKLSLSVDLLSALFTESDTAVAFTAMEVYIRRVYRAHVVKDLTMKMDEKSGLPVATWNFYYADIDASVAPIRRGMLAVLKSPVPHDISDLEDTLVHFQSGLSVSASDSEEPINTLILCVYGDTIPPDSERETAFVDKWQAVLQSSSSRLKTECGLRTVNVLVTQAPKAPRTFSFNYCEDYAEDPIRRDMRTSFPYLLELSRLRVNYDLERLPTFASNAQLWLASEKRDTEVPLSRPRTQSLFLRAISHSDLTVPGVPEKIMLILMDSIDSGLVNPKVSPSASSNIFLHVLPELTASAADVVNLLRSTIEDLVVKYAERLIRLRVENIELRTRLQLTDASGNTSTKPVRFWTSPASTESSFWQTDVYVESINPVTGVTEDFIPFESVEGTTLSQLSVPYSKSGPQQMKRTAARRVGSTYAYDLLSLFQVSAITAWKESSDPSSMPMKARLVSSKEMVLNEENELDLVDRPAGLNNIGMVGWLVTLRTPEYPSGRELVLIANDVTFQAGSFGVKEDEFFFKASEFARARGIPRIYVACNSGARIGLIESLKGLIHAAFKDENNPSLGFEYLYLTEQDFSSLPEGTVNARRVETNLADGSVEVRYALDDIIGQTHGIGVENLRGSGLIAGETSLAYDEIFTLSFATGRTVGIGAYLVRLGQRVIQQQDGPIILTGYQALNKLLGREVYTSLNQLGGPEIMLPNGVSHELVRNDQEGVNSIVKWLSFVPKDIHSVSPATPSLDPVDRDIEFTPPKGAYDVREMLAGRVESDGKITSGFFDAGSFKEYLADWGKSVVVGRARLGGIPMGVIAVETRTGDRRIPADPGNAESREIIEPQAGQVWFPDSAYKTAQAIQDFGRGEKLPIMIFANWRGFSGGTRDMFGEILKFGAMIVDALRTYKQPVFVYLPPNGELRGGAWVVVDPTINERMMEMYADKQSRGGILEPPGICEVKFRKNDQIKMMHRLDAELIALDKELAGDVSEEQLQKLRAAVTKRENTLLPIYLQIAHEFADLHDRSGRMLAKGVVRDVLDWKRAREYFYWRVKRRLCEFELRKQMSNADESLSWEGMSQYLHDLVGDEVWNNDKMFLSWSKDNASTFESKLKQIRLESIKNTISSLTADLSEEEKQKIRAQLG